MFEEGVLLQSFSSDYEGELYGFRVFKDGRLDRMEPEQAWRESKTLPRKTVDAIRDAIEELDVDALAAVHRLEVLPDDVTFSILQTEPGSERAIIHSWPCERQEVQALLQRIGSLL